MRLEDINALRELDRNELVKKAISLGIKLNPGTSRGSLPTADSIRLLIVEKTIEQETPPSTASKLGVERLVEAIKLHAEGVAIGDALARAPENDPLRPRREEEMHLNFEIARSATAIAQAGLTAATLAAVGDMLRGMGKAL